MNPSTVEKLFRHLDVLWEQHGDDDPETLLTALELEPQQLTFTEAAAMLMFVSSMPGPDLKQAAALWMVWHRWVRSESDAEEWLPVTFELLKKLGDWWGLEAFAHRGLSLAAVLLNHADKLPTEVQARVHAEYAECAHTLAVAGQGELLSAVEQHATEAMRLAQDTHEYTILANARDLYVLAIQEGSGPGKGTEAAIHYLRKLIITELPLAPLVTAKLRQRLAGLLMDLHTTEARAKIPPSVLTEAGAALREGLSAFQTREEWPITQHDMATLLGRVELSAFHAGDAGALVRAQEAVEQALQMWTEDRTPTSLGTSLLLYLDILSLQERPLTYRLHWLEKGLERLPESSPPDLKAELLLEYVALKREAERGLRPASEWMPELVSMLEPVELLIARCRPPIQQQLFAELVHQYWKSYQASHQLDEAIAVLKRLLKADHLTDHPAPAATIRQLLLSTYLQRKQGRDLRHAQEQLGSLLQLAGDSDCEMHVSTALFKTLWLVSIGKAALDLKPLETELSRAIAKMRPKNRERLQLCLDVWRCHQYQQPSAESMARRLQKALSESGEDERESWFEPSFQFVRKALGDNHSITASIAEQFESYVMESQRRLSPDSALQLLTLLIRARFVRSTHSPFQLRRAQELLTHGAAILDQFRHLPEHWSKDWHALQLEARIRQLGLSPERSTAEILQKAQQLESECHSLSSHNQAQALGMLAIHLLAMESPDPEVLQEWIRGLLSRMQAQGLPTPEGLVERLLQHEITADTRPDTPTTPALPPLNEVLPKAFIERVLKVRKLLSHGGHHPKESYAQAQKLLSEATQYLPAGNPRAAAVLADLQGQVCWLAHPVEPDAGHNTRGVEILERALEDQALLPSERATLLRQLALLEAVTEHLHLNTATTHNNHLKAIGHLETALALDLTEQPAVRFQVVVTLANAHRRAVARAKAQETTHLSRAIQLYRSAFEVWEEANRLSSPTGSDDSHSDILLPACRVNLADLGRLQKCLADALLLTRDRTQLEEARKLALESAETRLRYHDSLHAAESYLTLAQVEEARLRHQLPNAHEGLRHAVQEGRQLVTQESAPHVFLFLEEMYQRLRKEEPAATPSPHDQRRLEEAARISSSFLGKLNGERKVGKPELPFGDALANSEAMLRGDYAKSPLQEYMGRLVKAVSGLTVRLKKSSNRNAGLRSELDRVEGLIQRQLFVDAMDFLTAVLFELQTAPTATDIEDRAVELAQRLLHPDRLSAYAWGAQLFLLFHAASVCVHHHSRMSERQAYLAEDWLRRGIALAESKAPEDPLLPEMYNSLALALYHNPAHGRLGRWREVQYFYEQALSISVKRGDQHGEAVALLNLAVLFGELSFNDRSLKVKQIELVERVVTIHRRRENPIELAKALSNLGFDRAMLDDSHQPAAAYQAVEELEEARQLAESHPVLRPLLPTILNHLGLAHKKLFTTDPSQHNGARWKQARDCFNDSARLCKEHNDPFEGARPIHNLAILLELTGKPDHLFKAIELLEGILEVRLARPREAYETVMTLQRFVLRLADVVPLPMLMLRVTPKMEHCLELLWQSSYTAPALQLEYELCRLMIRTVRELEAAGGELEGEGEPSPEESPLRLTTARLAKACQRAETVMPQLPSLEAQLELSPVVGELFALWAWAEAKSGAKGLPLLQITGRSKAQSLLMHRRVRLRTRTPEEENQLLALELALKKAEDSQDPVRIHEQVAARDTMVRMLSEKNDEDPTAELITAEGLTERLKFEPRTAFVDITLSAVGCVIVTALRDEGGKLKQRVQRLELNALEVLGWLQGEPNGGPVGWVQLLHTLEKASGETSIGTETWLAAVEHCTSGMERHLLRLGERLLWPVVGILPTYGIEHLVISVSGPLMALPLMAASRIGKSGQLRYLVEDFKTIRLVPSLAVWLEELPQPRPLGRRLLLLAADPAQSLPTPEKHLAALESVWETRQASIERLGTALPGARIATPDAALRALERCDLVHILCHGLVAFPDLNRTGLQLEKELLSAERLLKRGLPLRAELVILCACRSALGRPDDVGAEWQSLAGLLLRAGVRQVIGALWDVNYLLSARLMEGLHSSLAEWEWTPLALGNAMRSILEENRRLAREPDLGVAHPLLQALDKPARIRVARLLPSPLFWAGFELLSVV